MARARLEYPAFDTSNKRRHEMFWDNLYGHEQVVTKIQRSIERGRLANSLMLAGPSGVGKFVFATKLAQAILCETVPETKLQPCGSCSACIQIVAGSHPDLLVIERPPDKQIIPIELFIGDRKNRMRDGMCHAISLKPLQGQRKVAIIRDADYLNPEGANCLLKTLEEPPPGAIIILICSNLQKQLPTIRSRCQILRFQPLASKCVAQLLEDRKLVQNAAEAIQLAELSQGSIEQAIWLADTDIIGFSVQLWSHLAKPADDSTGFARSLGEFIDAAGKDAPPRRQRVHGVLKLSVMFYRELTRVLAGTLSTKNDDLRAAVELAQQTWSGDETVAAACLDRCLDASLHVDRNANPSTLLDSWLEDLAQYSKGRWITTSV